MLGKLTLKVLPIEEENNREAIIHFELYRLLKNNLAVFTSSTIQSVIVEPEKGVSSGSVDLLILVETPDAIIPFLSIEVKRPSGKSYWLFTEESKKQVERYSRELKSTYSALTDGEVLRLFRFNAATQELTHLQDYNIKLNDEKIRNFLSGLLGLYENGQLAIPLSEMPDFDLTKFVGEIKGLTQTLIDTFDLLGNTEGFSLETKPDRRYISKLLGYGSFGKTITLSVEREEKELAQDTSFLYLELKDLRNRLGNEKLSKLLVDLKTVPYFEWIEPEKAKEEKEFTWKNLRDITLKKEVTASLLAERLREWFLKLSSG